MRVMSLTGVFSVLFALMLLAPKTHAKGSLIELENLQTLSEKSQQSSLPIMLIFGAEWCEYCQVLNEFVFDPMMLSKMYEGKVVIMRHVGVDEEASIPDWQGNLINKSNWAYQINADLTPTVLFFDANGKEVAPRIIGISELNLVTSLIHQNLNIAYKNMGLSKRIPFTAEQLEMQQQNQ